MPERSRPSLLRQSTDNVNRGRQRSTSPLLFFRSASASSLLRLRHNKQHGRHPSDSVTLEESDAGLDGDPQVGAQEAIFDVLPSFQMYNALHRHIPRGNVNADQHDLPPSYQETCRESSAGGLSVSSSSVNITAPGTADSSTSNSFLNLQALATQHVNIRTVDVGREPIEDDLGEQDADNINIEKLYSLPKKLTPVEIDIRITKHPVKPDKRPEEESILKEYTSGDIINGYVVIENKSTQPLKFEMFYVTLEGYATVIDKVNGKRTIKRFLRMVDIAASWSYACVESASGLAYTYGTKDYDSCVIGLNNTRILEPGVKYKKFFMFKFPMRLLDVSCKHEQFSHCLMPPSFGIDKFKSNGKYSSIRTNPLLGYGHLGTKGSPILTNDLVSEAVSINYAVDAKIVGKDSKSGKLNIMREKEYNLRFIPFGFNQPLVGQQKSSKQLDDFNKSIQKKISALELVFKRLEAHEKIRSQDVQGTDISGTIADDFIENSDDILNSKLRQLHIDNLLSDRHSFPLNDTKTLSSDSDQVVESEFNYCCKSESKSSKKKSIFSGLKSGIKTDQLGAIKSGIIVLSADIPKDGLPYLQPSLLKKTNKLENKNKHDQKNWKLLREYLSDFEKRILDKVSIRLKCIQSNNSEPHEPPEIVAVTTELIFLTSRSVNSIPIKLDAQLLLKNDKVSKINELYSGYLSTILKYQERFAQNYFELNELYNLSRRVSTQRELNFTDFISNQVLHDVECLSNFRVDFRELHHVFKEQIRTLKSADDDTSLCPSKSNSASNLLSATFSGSSNFHTSTPQAALFRSQIIHNWVKTAEAQYEREVDVNLVLNQDIKETLVPSFESCLCSRLYCLRVNVKFEGHIGTASLDIPVNIRLLEA